MSVFRRIVGRELPCTVAELLALAPQPLAPADRSLMRDLLTVANPSPAALHRLALACLADGQFGLARQHLNAALRHEPGYLPGHIALAATNDRLAQHQLAASHIDFALSHTPPHDKSRYALLCAAGLSMERAGQTRRARDRYMAALRHRPSDLFALHRLAALHLAHGNRLEASANLREILNHQPQDLSARVALGHLLQIMHRHEEAAWEYEQALCLAPESWEMPVEFARELQIIDNTDQAIRLLEKIVADQPHFPDLRMRLGNFYSLRGDDAAARDQYGQALALHPDYLDCHIALARHELRMGRPDDAADHFRNAIAINDLNAETYAGLAIAHRKCGRHRQGNETLASASRIAHNSAVLTAQLALLESYDHDPRHLTDLASDLRSEWLEDQIERDYMLLANHPAWSDVALRLALLLRLVHKPQEARKLLIRTIFDDPTCSHAWLQLGLLLHEARQARRAADTLGRAFCLDCRQLQLDYRLALIVCGEIEFDLAIECLEQNDPHPADVQRRIWTQIDSLHLTGFRAAPNRDIALAAH